MSEVPKTSYETDGYGLGRSFASSSRLNLQHYLWKDVVGHNISPHIPIINSQKFKVADVGAGTGIWLVDLSRKFPEACLHGFDISTDQYPQKEWMSANTLFKTLNIHEPIPEALTGQYDIVHVRLLVAVVKENDPSPILKNLTDMLRPGGHLQWSEYDIASIRVESVDPSVKTSEMQYLVEYPKNMISCDWLSRLPDKFTQQGLEGIRYDLYPSSPDIRPIFTQMYFMLAEEHSFIAMENSDSKKAGPILRRRIQEAAIEAKNGAVIQFTIAVTVGRKPTSLGNL